eukprot:768013-Hanusia_phi.AAC.13
MGSATRILRRIANRNARKAAQEQKYGGVLSQNSFNLGYKADYEYRPWLARNSQDDLSPYHEEEVGPSETEEECRSLLRARRAATRVAIIGCGKMGSKLAGEQETDSAMEAE